MYGRVNVGGRSVVGHAEVLQILNLLDMLTDPTHPNHQELINLIASNGGTLDVNLFCNTFSCESCLLLMEEFKWIFDPRNKNDEAINIRNYVKDQVNNVLGQDDQTTRINLNFQFSSSPYGSPRFLSQNSINKYSNLFENIISPEAYQFYFGNS